MITTKRILGISMLLFFVFSLSDNALAQRKRKNYLKKKNRKVSNYRVGSIHFDKNKQYSSIAIGLSSMNYFGDIAPKESFASTDIRLTKPGFSIHYMYRLHQNMFLRGNFTWARIKGDDFQSADPYDKSGGGAYRYVRNLSFRNDIKELSVTVSWDFFGNYGTFLNRMGFVPYVFAGAGVFYHNPKAVAPQTDRNGNPLPEAGQWVDLQPLGTEGQYSDYYPDKKPYSKFQMSLPMGLGLRWAVKKRWDLELQATYRWLFFDYIDDISDHFVDLGALDSDLAKVMSDRSTEQTSANSGDPRDFKAINDVASVYTYTSQYDGQTYTTYRGYGHEHQDNVRGGANENDVIISISFKVAYIITGSFKRAKFR